jgi:leucyl-tRNA synthetase
VITIPIQVNGKLRSRIEVPAGIDTEALKKSATADPRVRPWIENREIRDIIVVPKKLVNIVI